MADILFPTAEIRRGNKKEEEERNRMKKYIWSALLHRADHKLTEEETIKFSELTPWMASSGQTRILH